MSFGRLLAAGKSLVGLRRRESPYRAHKHVRLPKFGSPKNPFMSADAPTASMPVEAPVTESVTAPMQTPKPAPAVVEVPKVKAPKAPKSARVAGAMNWLGGLGKKLNPVSRLPRLRRPARSAAPVPAPTPTQGELSLDRVTVVRNDLSDTDYEVVRTTPAKPVSPVIAMTAEKLEPVGAAWNRLTTRFFGDDQS